MNTKNTTADTSLVHKELASLAIAITHATGKRAFFIDDDQTIRAHLLEDPAEEDCALVWVMATLENGIIVVYNNERVKNISALLPSNTLYPLMGVAALFDIEYCGVHPLSNGDADEDEEPDEEIVAASPSPSKSMH